VEEDAEAKKIAREEATKYVKVHPNDFKVEDLPKEWDWRKVKGFDFTTKVKSQGGCGSCYTFSFIESLEMRTKIIHDKEVHLNPNFILECNWLTEGCHG